MKNWKTTLAGLMIAGLGIFNTMVNNHQSLTIGNALPYVGIALGGILAKDSNVTGGTVQQ